MARKNCTAEENVRREKICELLQMANIGSADGIQNLFKHHCWVHGEMVWMLSWTTANTTTRAKTQTTPKRHGCCCGNDSNGDMYERRCLPNSKHRRFIIALAKSSASHTLGIKKRRICRWDSELKQKTTPKLLIIVNVQAAMKSRKDVALSQIVQHTWNGCASIIYLHGNIEGKLSTTKLEEISERL